MPFGTRQSTPVLWRAKVPEARSQAGTTRISLIGVVVIERNVFAGRFVVIRAQRPRNHSAEFIVIKAIFCHKSTTDAFPPGRLWDLFEAVWQNELEQQIFLNPHSFPVPHFDPRENLLRILCACLPVLLFSKMK